MNEETGTESPSRVFPLVFFVCFLLSVTLATIAAA